MMVYSSYDWVKILFVQYLKKVILGYILLLNLDIIGLCLDFVFGQNYKKKKN